MNIYIYGAKDFKSSVSSMLSKADITDGVQTINSLSRIKETIEESPKDIFIIDEGKIYQENFLHKKFSFLVPKDSIEKSFLDQHGIGDICFHSVDGIITYLKSRYEVFDKVSDEPKDIDIGVEEELEEISGDEIEELDEVVETTVPQEEISYKDLSEIEQIEEIEDFQMQEVVSELENTK